MSAAQTLTVGLPGQHYDIVIGADLLDQTAAYIHPLGKAPGCLLITDEAVAAAGHAARVQRSLADAGLDCSVHTVPAGEASKSWDRLGALLDALLQRRLERGSLILALGGGVVGDLAGFAAAILLRGVRYVQLPTTLLAQVDSSVGGKTGINAEQGKNLIGAFHQPALVLADTTALDSLPPRELRAGYAEVVKYGALGDAEFFAWLERHGSTLLAGDATLRAEAIRRSCAHKARIVEADAFETQDQRALLNLGHTFGHALERLTGYGDTLRHGEAVACGMVLAFDLSVRLGLCPAAARDRLAAHLRAVGLPSELRAIRAEGFAVEALLQAMQSDKKVTDGRLTFVLVRDLGQAFVARDVPEAALRATLAGAPIGRAA